MASSTFKKDAPIIKRAVFSYTVSSIAANTGRRVTATELGYVVPEGYKTCGVTQAGTTDARCVLRGFNAQSGYVDIRNVTGGALSNIAVAMTVSFIRSDLFEAI